MNVRSAVVSTDMTATKIDESGPGIEGPARINRRLRPLYLASALQGVIFWVPVEKLFMQDLGFTASTIGVMAAVYAAVVPFLEIPSGILADRWSRRGVLLVANLALAVSALVGGLSESVGVYLLAALFLGVYFAMQSGTVDSIVYDALLEETGDSVGFERAIGRLRVGESAALVSSALVGASVASLTSPRVAYLVTVPFALASAAVLLTLREPRLHRVGDPEPLRRQVALTYRTVLERGRIRPIVATMVLSSLLLQSLLEFGPLWMVALAAPTLLYGVHWAGLMSTSGFGGVLAGRVDLTRPVVRHAAVGGAVTAGVVLLVSHHPVVVIGAQVALALFLVMVGVFLTRLLHDEIPSTIRAGVASGVGTLTWLAFLPFALAFGFVADRAGVHASGWIVLVTTGLTAVSLLRLVAEGDEEVPDQCELVPDPVSA